jgi:DHA2 family multidrug resistance protein
VVVFHTQKINYGELVQWISPFSAALKLQTALGGWSADTAKGLAQIAAEVTRQATNIGYINSFSLYLWTSLLVYPLIALIAWPPGGHRPQS